MCQSFNRHWNYLLSDTLSHYNWKVSYQLMKYELCKHYIPLLLNLVTLIKASKILANIGNITDQQRQFFIKLEVIQLHIMEFVACAIEAKFNNFPQDYTATGNESTAKVGNILCVCVCWWVVVFVYLWHTHLIFCIL